MVLKLLCAACCRKQSSYCTVLSALECELQSRPYRLLTSQMAAVVDPRRSAVFQETMYRVVTGGAMAADYDLYE